MIMPGTRAYEWVQNLTRDDLLDYEYDKDLAPDIIAEELGVELPVRNAANDLWEALREDRALELIRDYIRRHDLLDDFIDWRNGGYERY